MACQCLGGDVNPQVRCTGGQNSLQFLESILKLGDAEVRSQNLARAHEMVHSKGGALMVVTLWFVPSIVVSAKNMDHKQNLSSEVCIPI